MFEKSIYHYVQAFSFQFKSILDQIFIKVFVFLFCLCCTFRLFSKADSLLAWSFELSNLQVSSNLSSSSSVLLLPFFNSLLSKKDFYKRIFLLKDAKVCSYKRTINWKKIIEINIQLSLLFFILFVLF